MVRADSFVFFASGYEHCNALIWSSHHRVVSIASLSKFAAPSAPLTVDRIGRELRPASMLCPRCGGAGIELILPGEPGPYYFCGNKECLVARYGPGEVDSSDSCDSVCESGCGTV